MSKITIGKIRTWCYRIAKYLGDYQAIRKGRVKQRFLRRIAGKIFGRMMPK